MECGRQAGRQGRQGRIPPAPPHAPRPSCRLPASHEPPLPGAAPPATRPPAIPAAGLHSEQLALLDLLVLARAAKFVGTKRRWVDGRVWAGTSAACSASRPTTWWGPPTPPHLCCRPPAPRSAFSYLARELRRLGGAPAHTAVLHPPRFGAFWQDGVMELAG